MANDKKFKVANRISFIFFILYFLTYFFLPIIEKNINYLWFFIFPCVFFISLIINLLIKYNKMEISNLEKVSKIATIVSILLSGTIPNTTSNSDSEKKVEEIKKYPSITPTWLLVLLFTTIFSNLILFMLFYDTKFFNVHISGSVILTASIISIVFILLGQISSTFALIYNNGKKDALKFWRTIIIAVIGLFIIMLIIH